jgi:serine/threonine protein kinase
LSAPAESARQSFTGTDRFEVIHRLGEGGMGVVYRAFDRKRRDTVALKTLHRMDASDIARLKREFRALADVSPCTAPTSAS